MCVCVCSLLTFIFNKGHDRSSAIKRNSKPIFLTEIFPQYTFIGVCVCVCVFVCSIYSAYVANIMYFYIVLYNICGASLVAQVVKNLPAVQETWVQGWEDPQRREWLPTPVFLPQEFHEQRSLVGYSSWYFKKSGMTE